MLALLFVVIITELPYFALRARHLGLTRSFGDGAWLASDRYGLVLVELSRFPSGAPLPHCRVFRP